MSYQAVCDAEDVSLDELSQSQESSQSQYKPSQSSQAEVNFKGIHNLLLKMLQLILEFKPVINLV
jgi:hypothetical protein